MAEALENNITVLSEKDGNLPDFVDFKILRKEGLEHIGALSGKIWTDHNVHDPGITMLEVLVYALMDLGYKTNLPFKDLVAPGGGGIDDNFLTPLDILTVNPVTITDYRKLLLEIEGVRNAWLEPTDQEVPLFIDSTNNVLNCSASDNSIIRKCNQVLERPFTEVHLNGIYKVFIEKDAEIISNLQQETMLQQEVRKLLAAHRNLCEDFKDEVCLLRPIEIGICAEVEIAKAIDPEKAYAQIVVALREYVQPSIKYYTLQELLDKGRTIDQIFAGRPYLEDSYGFVDTKELEELERRDEMYLSDLYTVILGIEGVLRVKKVHFKGGTILPASNSCNSKGSPNTWATGISIFDGQVPVFTLSETCIDLYSEQGFIPLNNARIHQRFSFARKFQLPEDKLNTQAPTGSFIPDLKDYYSIQNDFPVVYGIGDDGLPENASLQRKTEALQLKGYLMFYDQMLANYTAQLTHFRSLYSLTPEAGKSPEEKHTYFTQLPDAVPGLNKLLQFYQDDTPTKGARLALPVTRDEVWDTTIGSIRANPKLKLTIAGYCDSTPAMLKLHTFSSATMRSIYIDQLIDSFFNEAYDIEIIPDAGGYFFVLCPTHPADIVLVGIKRHETYNEALTDANTNAFLCGIKESYQIVSDMMATNGVDPHYFNLVYNPLSYISKIQEFSENNELYLARRKQFLDHLLARFGEEFTSYTLLQYQNNENNDNALQQTIEDQSTYVNQFAEISRNRAKAFDYLQPAWNTDNVSGFEKRIALLAGISNYDRRNLCNFEVVPFFKFQHKDSKGNLLFRTNSSYENRRELSDAARTMLTRLRDSRSYDYLERNTDAFHKDVARRLYSTVPDNENIGVAEYSFRQQLVNHTGDTVKENPKAKWNSEAAAFKAQKTFINGINRPKKKGDGGTAIGYQLVPISDDRYIDVNAISYEITTLQSWKCQVLHSETVKKEQHDALFTTPEEAWEYLAKEPECEKYLTKDENCLQWNLTIKGNVGMRGIHYHANKNRAVTAWRQAKMLGSEMRNYELRDAGDTVAVHLLNAKGKCIAISNNIEKDKVATEDLIADCLRVFENRNTKPTYEKANEKYGFSIPKKNGLPLLVSYNSYDSKREALEHMGQAYAMGRQKKNYLLSGDPGNPEYNFILKDASDDFLAMPANQQQTASDRDRALKSVLLALNKETAPLTVKEQPKRYTWSLLKNEKSILGPEKVFASKAKTVVDFNKQLGRAVTENQLPFLEKYCYRFHVKSEPASYNFIYGSTGADGEFQPIFSSDTNFKKEKNAKDAYTSFAENLPNSILKKAKKGTANTFELFISGTKKPVAVQYKDDTYRADLQNAEAIVAHLKSIYASNGTPKEEYIEKVIEEQGEGRYEWRFFKKNAPIAISPYACYERKLAQALKAKICEVAPPISLDECPPKSKVVCPDKNPGKFHYQVCFKDKQGRNFVLISYCGYNTHVAAETAWEEHWLQVIGFARDENNYGKGGKISLEETYKKPNSNACDDVSFIAVIPEVNRKKTLVDTRLHYCELANLYPIYQLEPTTNNDCSEKYSYRVGVSKDIPIGDFCEMKSKTPYKGTLLWESEECFDSSLAAIHAYQHFYTLVSAPNNCRVLCKHGLYYVGLLEVLVESPCEFISEEAAWDATFPENGDECNSCLPGGVREFVYAAEDARNYIPICEAGYWSFKVVSPAYFIADYACYYDTEKQRDEEAALWVKKLTQLDWKKYINTTVLTKEKAFSEYPTVSHLVPAIQVSGQLKEDVCDFVQAVRECRPKCEKIRSTILGETEEEKRQRTIRQIRNFVQCLPKKYRSSERLEAILKRQDFDLEELWRFVDYFPIYKTNEGYCYRLYWPSHDEESTPNGLQPCGCGDDKEKVSPECEEPHPFVSSNCYPCCKEALDAFAAFCLQVEEGLVTIDCKNKSPYGPFSFRLINAQKELGRHPQRYGCKQEVLDAIERTKACVDNTGMHLLEHILLRPKSVENCNDAILDTAGNEKGLCCLLPICPDYCCDIEWRPDMDKEDPCAKPDIQPDPNLLYYLPGSDPYSFWATIALPAWDKRFRTQESRNAFEKLLYQEVPALVGLHILWLSPRDLCKFEDAYSVWLEWIQNQNKDKMSCAPNGIDPACLLTDCIKRLTSEAPCPTVPGASGNCNCGPEDREHEDYCCLPPETTGSIFWGYCPQTPPTDTVPSDNFFISNPIASKEVATVEVDSPQSAIKPLKKKKASGTKITDEKKTLALVRKRKPAYLKNIMGLTPATIQETKSFERVAFYLKNAPTVLGYVKLADFFNRHSLQKGTNKIAFLELIKNATWHLLDKLVLDKANTLSKADLEQLQKALRQLQKKGISVKEINSGWKINEVMAFANSKTLKQIKEILN